jgi:hypothetical protein
LQDENKNKIADRCPINRRANVADKAGAAGCLPPLCFLEDLSHIRGGGLQACVARHSPP